MKHTRKEVEITLYGKVQGVGLRAFAKKYAEEQGIVGWVSNHEDGHVEVVAQGEEDTLLDFIALLRKGPVFSRIEDAKVIWFEKPQDTFQDFEIL